MLEVAASIAVSPWDSPFAMQNVTGRPYGSDGHHAQHGTESPIGESSDIMIPTTMSLDPTIPASNSFGNEDWSNVSPYDQSSYGNSPITDYGFQPHYGFQQPLSSQSLSRMPPPQQQPQFHPHAVQPQPTSQLGSNFQPQGVQPQQSHFPSQLHQSLPSPQIHQNHTMLSSPLQPAPSPQQSDSSFQTATQQQHPHMVHQQLPQLNTSNTRWPSQLTNPSPSTGSFSAPPQAMIPMMSARVPDSTTPRSLSGLAPAGQQQQPLTQPEKGRKSLSNEAKRQMCQYAEDNPGAKQTEIGAKFGVERSTVSKVLAKKDEYLQRSSDNDPGQAKRWKGKHHSLERTLVSFANKQKAKGLEVTDKDLMDQARFFARADADNKQSLLDSITPNWLRKFKRENKIGNGTSRLTRRASETNIPDSARLSATRPSGSARKARVLRIASPTSDGEKMSPLSDKASEDDSKITSFDFNTYKQMGPPSNALLISDGVSMSYPASTMSPVAPFTFSPDPNTGAFQLDPNMQQQDRPFEFGRERRSNTFPTLAVELVNRLEPVSSVDQKAAPQSSPSSAIDRSVKELKPLLPANNVIMSHEGTPTGSPTLQRQSSNSSLNNRVNPTPTNSSSGASKDNSPVSPTLEEARRSVFTVMTFVNNQMNKQNAFDQSDVITLQQIIKKLQVHQPGMLGRRSSRSGLSRIEEGDFEARPDADMGLQDSKETA